MTQLPIGALVTNFGVIAKVVGHHAITGDPILRAHDIRFGGEQWLASAAFCEPLGEPAAVLLHKDGLVALG